MYTNHLFFGFLSFFVTGMLSACNAEPSTTPQDALTKITSTTGLQASKVEASGIVYIDPNRYWLVSDETSQILEMNGKGILTQAISIQSGENIDDLESISYTNQELLVCSSTSATKRGNIKKDRHRCLALTPAQDRFQATRPINIYSHLQQAASDSTDKQLRKFLKKALDRKTQDVEAHAIHQGHLLLGLKNPQHKGKAVILDMGNLAQLQGHNAGATKIWQTLDFNSIDPKAKYRLSDMTFLSSEELILTSSGKKRSALWKYHVPTQQLTQLRVFEQAQAEGLTINSNTGEIVVVFDGGNDTGSSLYIHQTR